MTKALVWTDSRPPYGRGRLVAAATLRAAGRALDRLAWRLVTAPARAAVTAPPLPQLEFHADAGAPEGALYVNGEYVGHLPGVTRL